MSSMNSLFLSVLATALVAYVSCSHAGESQTYRKQDGHGNYAFGYDIKDGKGASNFRKEHGNGWERHGSYGLHDLDGRARVVEYVADKGGFRAHIKTNEPGTGSLDAAAAVYNGQDEHGHSYTHVVSGSHGHGHDNGGGHYNDGHHTHNAHHAVVHHNHHGQKSHSDDGHYGHLGHHDEVQHINHGDKGWRH